MPLLDNLRNRISSWAFRREELQKLKQRNSNALRRAADALVSEFESLPYETLADPLEPSSYQREIEGLDVLWTVDVVHTRNDGAIKVEMLFYSSAPTLNGKPARSFWKQKPAS